MRQGFEGAEPADARAVDLRELSVYQVGPKFKIKHKIHCFRKSKVVDWGGKHVDWGTRPLLAPALEGDLTPFRPLGHDLPLSNADFGGGLG